ncbi:hypothetical protein B0T26DRAFT_681056 [Lasiosphaeria miniovina]|uniref:Secreted protein n=1 Tax=Lasiosphaeria miniovina TaxID=1954250 RepID=A0AA40DJ88_9PEZI|nr:uncharacterized protein B0T26DRAFT_681056 [Lasiosphaeria miniovina]KAK0703371.1 hypothetical protein B0T26DRAFT_681056 [Lasiosphaeria miniovina]
MGQPSCMLLPARVVVVIFTSGTSSTPRNRAQAGGRLHPGTEVVSRYLDKMTQKHPVHDTEPSGVQLAMNTRPRRRNAALTRNGGLLERLRKATASTAVWSTNHLLA